MFNTTLDQEYNRWKFKRVIDKLIYLCSPNNTTKYELENILERWMINMSNLTILEFKNDTSTTPIDIYQKTSFDNDVNQKFLSELNEKRIFNSNYKRTFFVIFILKLSYLYLDHVQYRNKTIVFADNNTDKILLIDKNTFNYKLFTKSFHEKRFNLLQRITNITTLDIAKMFLRYESIILKGQQWHVPLSVFRYCYKNYDARIEGFASPLNSQLLKVALEEDKSDSKQVKPNIKFCSMYPDTDAPFGSIGSFFDLRLEDINCTTVLVNPPFIEDILRRTVLKMQELIEIAEIREPSRHLRFVTIMPYWSDYLYINRLKEYKHTVYYKILNRNSYYYEKYGSKIHANFDSIFFIIEKTDGFENVHKYSDLVKFFRKRA